MLCMLNTVNVISDAFLIFYKLNLKRNQGNMHFISVQ